VTLTDAGPLVALIDADEQDHDACRRTLADLSLPLVTSWPAFTEAMYLLGRAGLPGQAALWRLALSERLEVVDLSEAALARSAVLMAKYADLPMDLADATLVALAEELGETVIFALDIDFSVYRLHGRRVFRTVPTRS
jgi:uncharacterized protein